jgi:hypothetical protein
MVETAETEATIEEIVVALRETRRGAGRALPFTVVDGGQPSDNCGSGTVQRGGEGSGARGHSAASEAQNGVGSTDVGDLRDDEIERLLTENAQLNERIMFLLKVIGREQAHDAENAAIETDRGVIFRDLRAALEAELRPFLLVLLRLLEKQRVVPVGESTRRATPKAAHPAAPVAVAEIGFST